MRPEEVFKNYFRQQGWCAKGLLQLTYLSAYEILPTAVQREGDVFWARYWENESGGDLWYRHLCQLTETPLDPFSACAFEMSWGRISDGAHYILLQYPEPLPVEHRLSDCKLDAPFGIELPVEDEVLAPYFSLVTKREGDYQTYALGQAPVDQFTTLRLCRLGAHYNLGRGDEPTAESLLALAPSLADRRVLGATIRFRAHLDEVDEKLLLSLSETD